MRPRHVIASLLASLAVSGLGPGVRQAHAQVQAPAVRIEKPDIVVRSRPSTKSEVVAPAPAGTELFVMDREENWLWVLLPADINGTRRPGWIRSADLGAPGENPAPAPESRKERNAKKRAEAGEGQAQSQQLTVAENRRLKQEQAAASRQAKREADVERRLKAQQAAEEQRLQKQQVLADRRTKAQQAEEDRRLERAKRELEKAKQEFDKVAKSDSSEPAK